MSLLNAISTPADVRKLSMDELTVLAGEMRDAHLRGRQQATAGTSPPTSASSS